MNHNIFSVAFTLFVLMDSIGNIPFFISFLNKVEAKKRYRVILRELLIALGVIVGFSLSGTSILNFLSLQYDTIQIAGGILLFLISLKMVFPPAKNTEDNYPHETEPFIVPLAIPLIAGPAVLSSVMIYTQQIQNHLFMIGAIFLAWAVSLIILLLSPILQRFLGWRGILALERLMGLILTLIAVEMFLQGLLAFNLR